MFSVKYGNFTGMCSLRHESRLPGGPGAVMNGGKSRGNTAVSTVGVVVGWPETRVENRPAAQEAPLPSSTSVSHHLVRQRTVPWASAGPR